MFHWLTWLRDAVCGPELIDEDQGTGFVVPFPAAITTEIPICGNSWVTYCRGSSPSEYLTEDGCCNWECPQTVWSIFFRMSKSETIFISLRLRIPGRSQSRLRLSLLSNNGGGSADTEINISDAGGGEYQNIQVGQFHIQEPGYVRFNLQGIMRTGDFFAQVSHLLVSRSGDADNEIIFNSTQDSYFGRRGPSIHLCYQLGDQYLTEYFYNEVTIPPGSDALGLYAMAIGFAGGYFGIQVNGPSERRVLFSIWSEFDTQDPLHIPEEYKVTLMRKGRGVIDGEFGNEGSGAQSYLQFTWKAGTVYKFLVQARPLDETSTLYQAWFKDPASDIWQLVATFRKPKVSTYLTDVYSFLENFEPDQGHLPRVAFYGNQWARDCEGHWHEVTRAKFTGDATSEAGRRDFAGGLVSEGTSGFYLKHCGFFSDTVPTGQHFERCQGCNLPDVDVEDLP